MEIELDGREHFRIIETVAGNVEIEKVKWKEQDGETITTLDRTQVRRWKIVEDEQTGEQERVLQFLLFNEDDFPCSIYENFNKENALNFHQAMNNGNGGWEPTLDCGGDEGAGAA